MSVKLTRRPKDRSRWSFCPRLESLEDRRLLAVVTNINDAGAGSLRQAILDVNANPGLDTISFSIPGVGVQTIQPLSQLPSITAVGGPVVIDGETELPDGYVELSGLMAGAGATGLTILAGNSTVRGMVINRFTNGITLSGGGNNVLTNNRIGTDVAGTIALANVQFGISIVSGSENNVIGGTVANTRNLISGNGSAGISIGTKNNLVLGNLIGTNAIGTGAIGNGIGIRVFGGTTNTIGGTIVAVRNIISGNNSDGIAISSNGKDNRIWGNFIGADINGTVGLGNGNGISMAAGSDNNIVGGTLNGEGNLISGNKSSGISISSIGNRVEGNRIGTEVTGTAALNTLPNTNNLHGITIASGANNIIGGTIVEARNLISGNLSDGVNLSGTGNKVWGNYIGTDLTGTYAVANIRNGVTVTGTASNNEIGGTVMDITDVNVSRNIISGNKNDGVALIGSNVQNNIVSGNYIGPNPTGAQIVTDVTGTITLGNEGNGVTLLDGAKNNTIGGTHVINLVHASRNIISGNGEIGVHMLNLDAFRTTNNKVEGNYIGTDVTGTVPLGNDRGVAISGAATFNTIGGTTAQARNLVSGNTGYGVGIFDRFTSNNKVEGNFIGTDVTGTLALGNGDGVHVFGAASNNTIGGTTPRNPQVADLTNVSRNLISGNTNNGLRIYDTDTSANKIQGNFIGTDVTGTLALANGNGVQFDGGATANLLGGTIVAGDLAGTVVQADSRNVISGNTGYGVGMLDSHTSLNRVEGNFIGTDVSGIKAPTDLTGTIAMSNQIGVSLYNGANGNIIGGTVVVDDVNRSANVISANLGDGVEIWGKKTDRNVVLANLIGTDLSGTLALGNGAFCLPVPCDSSGIHLYFFAASNQIGWLIDPNDPMQTIVVAGNTIVHHPSHGIWITEAATRNVLYGNFIGTDKEDNLAQPNLGHGILINTINFDKKTTDNVVGSNLAGRGNTIRNNGDTVAGVGDGVRVDSGGFAQFAAARNAIRGNHISDNVGMGIDLVGTGQGGNLLQKSPDITSVTYDGINVSVHFELNSTLLPPNPTEFVPNRQYNVDFFISPGTLAGADCDGFGVGAEGEFYRVSRRPITDPNGDYSSVNTPPMPQPVLIPLSFLQPNSVVTATVTDRSGNTSEFSLCMPIPPFPIPTPPERPSTSVVADLHLNRPGADIIVTAQAKAPILASTRAGDSRETMMSNKNDFAEAMHGVVQRNRAKEKAPETNIDSNDFLMIDL